MHEIEITHKSTKTQIIQKIASLVKTIRIQANLTQTELATATHTSQPAIARLESGKDSRLTSVFLLAKLFTFIGAKLSITIKEKLPSSFKTYFWDVDVNNIDPQKHRAYIIERLLDVGDTDAFDWLNKTYDRLTLIWVLKTSPNLTRRSANFWALYFQIPLEDIKCLRQEFPKKRIYF